MGLCLMALGLGCIGIGFVILITTPRETAGGSFPMQFPTQPSTQGTSRPTGMPGGFSLPIETASTQPNTGGFSMKTAQEDGNWSWIRVGQRVRAQHPTRGKMTLFVLGKITFDELWQRQRGADVPWVSTGNHYTGFWCEQNILLLNWQDRYYMLDERDVISDVEIARHFAERAREFGQSDQKADVYVAYPPTSWHIDDIGRIKVAAIEGEAQRFIVGAEGRFIHGSSSDGRGLVVEDYTGGGGQDSAWIGVIIDAGDVSAG